jgi:hypothetical protein
MGKRNQERRRAKKRERDARQRSAAGPRSAGGWDGGFGGEPGRVPRRLSPGETVESIVAGVVGLFGVPAGVVEAALADGVTALTGPPFQRPDGWGGVSEALLGVAERIVSSCWQGGWQPADLARVVGRALTAQHVRLAVDAIAAEARRHAAATEDPRWSAQVHELGAAVWWADPRGYLDAVGRRDGLDRAGTVRCVLELLRLLAGLPELPPAGPAPGQGGHRTARPAGAAAAEPRILARVRALLAQAESTNYPEEADAFTAKAQQLMARHSISAALLDADAQRHGEPAARRIGVDNPYEAPKALLLDAVTAANRCRSVWFKALGFSTVVGYEPDLDSVELLYTSLLVQATAAMNRAGARRDGQGRSRTRTFRQSFLVAYASRIGQRLTEATDSAVRDAAAGLPAGGSAADGADSPADPRLLPVLAARADAVTEATERMFPDLTLHALAGNDREGWAHGTAAADRAILRDQPSVTRAG